MALASTGSSPVLARATIDDSIDTVTSIVVSIDSVADVVIRRPHRDSRRCDH